MIKFIIWVVVGMFISFNIEINGFFIKFEEFYGRIVIKIKMDLR